MPKWGPITSVADARRRARKRMPKPIYMACVGGRGAGNVLKRNATDLEAIVFNSRVGDEPNDIDLRTRVLGQDLSMPLLLAPVGVQAIRPNAEVAATRAAAAAGTTFALSNFASQPLEEVIRHNPRTFVQLYWGGTRELIAERVHRYRQAGAPVLIVTLDWSVGPGTDWDAGAVPATVGIKTMAQFAPAVLPHPAWLFEFLSNGELPTLEVPQFATKSKPRRLFVETMEEVEATPQPSWDDIAWLKQEWGGPLMVKGILNPEDARRAVALGADAISVSNHGGNTFDDNPSAISCLQAVAEAVGDEVEVLMDGGVRRGSDVVKALALGARAVMIGRSFLWPLAVRGEEGVAEILEVFRTGIRQALQMTGAASADEIGPEQVSLPDHWSRAPVVPLMERGA